MRETRGASPRNQGGEAAGKRLKGKATADGKLRTTFDFAPETIDALERVRVKSGSNTGNEAIRRSLALFERHLDEVAAGSLPVYERPDGTRVEIVIV